MDVRPEAAQDFAAVRTIHERAFAPSREEADLVEALRAARDHVPQLCLVAARGGSVIGHIAFSRALLDSGHPLLVLAPMGVLPGHQRQGVGSALVRAGLLRAAETEYPLVVVVGHAAYYPRFGFEPATPLGITAPFEVPDEAWMVYRLPGYTDGSRGTVAYPDAFSTVSA